MNASAFDASPRGDVAAGERFFFGKGQCGTCHTAMGAGTFGRTGFEQYRPPVGPGRYERKLKTPMRRCPSSYATVTVKLRDGRTVRGFARKETLHGLQLQTLDGKLMLLTGDEYEIIARDKTSRMPAA